MKSILICLIGFGFFSSGKIVSIRRPRPLRIASLPRQPYQNSFDMYSGYLKAGNGNNLFYWLNEMEKSKSKKSLIIWLHGGPGCSSLQALFNEHGPYYFSELSGNLTTNEFSWNKFANTLYIDSPLKTGFSQTEELENLSGNATVLQLHKSLEYFFWLHPKYKKYKMFLAGQQFGSIFISLLATEIAKEKYSVFHKNFKGIILENPLLKSNHISDSSLEFAYHHGFLGMDNFKLLSRNCMKQALPLTKYSKKCSKARKTFNDLFSLASFINNRGQKCWLKRHEKNRRYSTIKKEKYIFDDFSEQIENKDQVGTCRIGKHLLKDYLNSNNVQKSINVFSDGNFKNKNWQPCKYNLMKEFEKSKKEIGTILNDLLKKYKTPILMYHGDKNLQFNFFEGQDLAIKLKLKRTRQRKVWMVRNKQLETIGGFSENFGRLKLATILNTGLKPSIEKPEEVFTIVRRFIESRRIK